MVEQD
jgi:hypothetical protein